jgi:hypothetical protein
MTLPATRDLLPRDVRLLCLRDVREILDCLAHYLELAKRRVLPHSFAEERVTASARVLVRENVVVQEGLNLALDLVMKVGGIDQIVEVRGTRR